jgi:hypothetical protein
MEMTNSEIKANVLQAADQRAQIRICAELNDVSVDCIKAILKEQGVDLRELKGAMKPKQRMAETNYPKDRKKYTRKLNPEELVPDRLQGALAAIRAEIADINRQQYQLDMRKGDLYNQIWDMLAEVE